MKALIFKALNPLGDNLGAVLPQFLKIGFNIDGQSTEKMRQDNGGNT
jgi:hypothetical protein